MNLYVHTFRLKLIGLTALFLLFLSACNPGARMLNRIPVNSVDVKVVDQNDRPIPGAQVEASNGRKTTTDAEGMAKIRFGGIGIHSISVIADNRMPSNVIVTLPADRGKTIVTRLTDEIRYTGFTFGSAQLYPLLFNYLFSTYGYSLQLNDYNEGDWTRWSIRANDEQEAFTMQKAFLKRLDNGQEWWQVRIASGNDDTSTYIAEILFSEDRTTVRRLREQIGDEAIQEKPVAEGWYTEPAELTEESIRGAVSERGVSVSVPKGTFTADLLEYGVVSDIYLNLWRVDEVPGGVAKYENRAEGEVLYTSELIDFGDDARTLLESY